MIPTVLRIAGRRVPVGSHAGKTVVLGSDHRGFALKEWLRPRLRRLGYPVVDVGTRSAKRVDYPVYTLKIARAVGRDGGRRTVGIGVCGSGIGVCIVAAKVPGVLPAMPATVKAARETRTHNNTNFLSLSADWMSPQRSLAIAKAWLAEAFVADPAYVRRYLQTVRLDDRKTKRA